MVISGLITAFSKFRYSDTTRHTPSSDVSSLQFRLFTTASAILILSAVTFAFNLAFISSTSPEPVKVKVFAFTRILDSDSFLPAGTFTEEIEAGTKLSVSVLSS